MTQFYNKTTPEDLALNKFRLVSWGPALGEGFPGSSFEIIKPKGEDSANKEDSSSGEEGFNRQTPTEGNNEESSSKKGAGEEGIDWYQDHITEEARREANNCFR